MTCSCDSNAIAIERNGWIVPNNLSENPLAPLFPRHHRVALIGTFMCLIKGTKLIVMWESLLSNGLTTSKVNVSSRGPMGSNGWETRGKGEGMWWEDVESHPGFILIPAVSLLGAPVVQHCGGGDAGPQRREWGRVWGCGGREWAGPYSLPRGEVVLISVRISNLNILSS